MLTKKTLSKQGLANIRAGVAKRMAKKRADVPAKDKRIKKTIMTTLPLNLKGGRVELLDPISLYNELERSTVIVTDNGHEGVLVLDDGSVERVWILNINTRRSK